MTGGTIVRLRYIPWQKTVRKAIVSEGCKIAVLACAARTGKDRVSDYLMAELPIKTALERIKAENAGLVQQRLIPRVNCWTVAPNRKLFAQAWDEAHEFLPKPLIIRSNRQDGEIRLKGDISYKFKSADQPETLVAEGVDYLRITEASRIRSELAWNESLQPRLASPGRVGLALINGSPRNGRKHWFRKLWEQALAAERSGDKKMRQWNLPMSANPLMADKVAELMARMPARLAQHEVMGIWPDEDADPFKQSDLDAIWCDDGPELKGPFIIAIDSARFRDFTFCTCWAPPVIEGGFPQVIDALMMRRAGFDAQYRKIKGFWQKHPGKVIVDSTNNGGTAFQEGVQRTLGRGVIVEGYDFHGTRRQDLYDSLVFAVEQRAFRIRRDLLPRAEAEQMRTQMDEFECELDDDGNWYYSGDPDDAVTSLGLGWYLAQAAVAEVDTFDMISHLESVFATTMDDDDPCEYSDLLA